MCVCVTFNGINVILSIVSISLLPIYLSEQIQFRLTWRHDKFELLTKQSNLYLKNVRDVKFIIVKLLAHVEHQDVEELFVVTDDCWVSAKLKRV